MATGDPEDSAGAISLMPSGHPSGLPGPGSRLTGPNGPGVTTNSNSRRQGINIFKSKDSPAPSTGLSVT